MCDECSLCYRPSWQAGELRLDATNELICSDCFGDDDDWSDLVTLDEAAEMRIAALDDMAHAARDRRAGL